MRKPKLSEAAKTVPLPEDEPMPNWGAILPVRPNMLPTDIPTDYGYVEIGPSGDNPLPIGPANTKNVAGAGVSSRVGPSAGQSMYPGQGK